MIMSWLSSFILQDCSSDMSETQFRAYLLLFRSSNKKPYFLVFWLPCLPGCMGPYVGIPNMASAICASASSAIGARQKVNVGYYLSNEILQSSLGCTQAGID